jgi:hypothetical protein
MRVARGGSFADIFVGLESSARELKDPVTEDASVGFRLIRLLSPCGALGGDTDGDGICNDIDACPEWANALPLKDTNGDDIPDDCQCGDFNGNGFLTALDVRNIIKCSTGSLPPEQCPMDLLDVNLSGDLTGTDARNINKGSTGSLQTYELRCTRRPSGQAPPDIWAACALEGVSCAF